MKKCNCCGKYDNVDSEDFPCDNCEGIMKEVNNNGK